MPRTLDPAELQRTVDAYAECGNKEEVSRRLSRGGPRISAATIKDRLRIAERLGVKPSPTAASINDPIHLQHRIKMLEKELAASQAERLNESVIRRHIVGLADECSKSDPPTWTKTAPKPVGAPGVPVLFVSDLHWGERVFPNQIGGVNKYDLEIAHARMDRLAEGATRLLGILSPDMDYPGIVIPLGGDMISGNIHDELTATNQLNTMPTILDLFGKLASFLKHMADTFGAVFVPCVSGNHGRDTTKIWHKGRNHTSFDWLLYCFLAKHFEGDKRVTFYIPDGSDAYFKLYNTRFLLTHGDQFRGGDGMIGALGPIIRGDHKKRSRNAQIDMAYDVLMLGHWHQYIHLTRLIVNGTLKGYDEYASANNFGFELPQQALFVVHPKYGITFRAPVFVDRAGEAKKAAWVSVAA
jgi:hypothetical protein